MTLLRDLGKSIAIFLFAGTMTFLAMMLVGVAFASDPTVIIPVEDAIQKGWEAINGARGGGAMVIAAAAVQVTLLFFRTKLASWAGAWRLTVVLLLSWGYGVLSLMTIGGLGWAAALVHSQSMAAFQVFGSQLLKQFFTKEDAPLKLS